VENFSVFEQALKYSATEHTEDLGEIVSISRRTFTERESFICRTSQTSLEYACLMIENALLLRTNRTGRVYAGFEKLSAIQPIIDRYLRIADVSDSVYLFGQDDWRVPRHPNIRVMPLSPDTRLAHETFLITHSSTLNIALVSFATEHVVSELRNSDALKYWLLKTSSPPVVSKLANAMEMLIDWTLAA